jgi:uncharacterized protein YbjT (DUF2867 family)
MYLVTGATGQLGRRIVHKLRDRNQPVRAFVRLMSAYSPLKERGAEILIGDLCTERDIARACQGIKYVISAHASKEGGTGGSPQILDYRANIELIDQSLAAGVEHFTLISVLGVEQGYPESPVFKAKFEVEQYLQASGLNYTILRSAGFASNLLPGAEQFSQSGVYLLIGNPDNRISPISTDDLAYMAMEVSQCPQAHQKIWAIGGPEVLQRGDIPKILGRILRRQPTVINIPLLAVDSARGAIGWFNPQLKEDLGTFRLLLAQEFFCEPEEITAIEQLFRIKLETVESFLVRYLKAEGKEKGFV